MSEQNGQAKKKYPQQNDDNQPKVSQGALSAAFHAILLFAHFSFYFLVSFAQIVCVCVCAARVHGIAATTNALE